MEKISEVKQISDKESTETILNISYADKVLNIYSNRATVINRILKQGYKPARIFRMDGEIEAMEFEVSTKEIGKFMRTGLFKYD